MQNQPQQYVQQPTFVMVPPQALENKFKQSALSQIRVMSTLQIVIGVLCIVFGAALTGLASKSRHYAYGYYGSILGLTGGGIWIGVWYIIVGLITTKAVRRNSPCWTISTMVLNIISSSLWCTTLIGLSATGVAQKSSQRIYYRIWDEKSDDGEKINTNLALNCLLLVLAIAELAITIWSAALCCGAVCRCCKSSQMATQYYTTQQPMMYGGGPAVAYPGAQPVAIHGQYIQPTGVQPQATVQIQPQPTVQIQLQPTVQIQPQPTVQIQPQPTVQIPPQPTVQIQPQQPPNYPDSNTS